MKFWIPWLAALLVSCSGEKNTTGLDLMPEMVETDSIQIIYFKSPDEPRYFTYTAVSDLGFIKSLVGDITAETISENPCMKEGKIYCYKKGEIFNTIFFAYIDDECSFLRYIKNGNLYYFKMSPEVKGGLKRFKDTSVEPKAAG